MTPVLRLTVAYDGADFAGWQLQENQRTVQGELEAALIRLLGHPLRATAAGRTDAGVHAEGQVVSVVLEPGDELPLRAFVHGLNRFLPEDIAVRDAAFAPEGFDARQLARGKHYRYRLLNRPTRSPLHRRTHWVLFAPLDRPPMEVAAEALVGEHDFAAFRSSDCPARTTRRRLDRIDLHWNPDLGELTFEVEGTAFLKHMVRNLVGTLVAVGRHRLPATQIQEILGSGDRRRAGPTAPAQGLCLVSVKYDEAAVAALEGRSFRPATAFEV
jgi:tRNA pseudouridine38-40 synthase